MQYICHLWIWLIRICHCRGFGIQSPTDYWFVRYVVNEHWPYYQYSEIGNGDDWLTRKLGLLYFRLANWLQPDIITSSHYHEYLLAGCHSARIGQEGQLTIIHANEVTLSDALFREQSVVVIENIQSDKTLWQHIKTDPRATITFDLYYCGIIICDSKRTKKNSIINF